MGQSVHSYTVQQTAQCYSTVLRYQFIDAHINYNASLWLSHRTQKNTEGVTSIAVLRTAAVKGYPGGCKLSAS